MNSPSSTTTPQNNTLLEKEYVATLTPEERVALNVAQTGITNIFRLRNTVGYKKFLEQRNLRQLS